MTVSDKPPQHMWRIFRLGHILSFIVFLRFPKHGFQDAFETTCDLPRRRGETFPHHVAVITKSTNETSWWCGGSIVSKKFVLTAAHCLKSIQDVTIVLNTTKKLKGGKVTIHPKWQPLLLKNDIALIELPRTPSLPDLNPIEVSFRAKIAPKRAATVYGWEQRKPEPIWSKHDVVIISNEDCAKYYGALITRYTVCAERNGPGNDCHGSSGGGLVMGGMLVGMVSFGTDQCDAGYPTVYTKISRYKGWIEKYIDT